MGRPTKENRRRSAGLPLHAYGSLTQVRYAGHHFSGLLVGDQAARDHSRLVGIHAVLVIATPDRRAQAEIALCLHVGSDDDAGIVDDIDTGITAIDLRVAAVEHPSGVLEQVRGDVQVERGIE